MRRDNGTGIRERFRLDWVEVCLTLAFVGFVGFLAGYTRSNKVSTNQTIERIRERYGPSRNSTGPEEWLIRDFFQDQRGGVFLDVGAGHYREHSNTYFLESRLGWSGIAIDAQGEYEAEYRRHRPRTRFFALFVSDVSGGTEEIHVSRSAPEVSSSTAWITERESKEPPSVREVPTTTLNELLQREGIARVDLVSMDIELAEPRALAGFDIERFRPSLVCIEAHEPVRQAILDYFARHRYVLVGKYLWLDPFNLYFTSVGDQQSPPSVNSSTDR